MQADNFSNGVKAAQRESKELEKAFRPVKELAASIGTAFAATGIAIAGSLAAMVKSAADYGDSMNDAAKRTGLTTESLSKLRLAAETSGSSFDGLTTGLKFLGKNMELATSGGKEQIKAFAAAGISAKDLAAAHGDVNKILPKLADSFAAAADGSGKTAVSMALLGKSGTDLIPMLNEGSAGLEHWGDVAQKSGRVISAEAAKAADEFNDQLQILEGSLKGISGTIGSVFIPSLTELFKNLQDVANATRKWVEAHPELTRTIGTLSLALTGAGGLVLGLTAVLKILPQVTQAIQLLGGAAGVSTTALRLGLVVALFELAQAGNALKQANMDLRQSDLELGKATQKLADEVASAGGPIIRAHGNLVQWNAEVIAAAKGIEHLNPTLEALIKKHNDEAEAATKAGMSLGKNTDEIDKNKKAAEELVAFWRKASEEFSNQTFAGGESANEGLRESERTVRKIIAAYNDLLKVEQEAGDELIRNNQYWDEQLQKVRNVSKAVEEDVKTGEAAADATATTIIKANKDAADKTRKAYDDAFKSVKDTASRTFLEIFKDGEFRFKALGDSIKGIFATLANEILSTMTAKLITPLVLKITDALSGLLGKIPGLGGILGGAGSGAAGTIGAGAGAAGGAAAGGAGGLGATVGGLATNPITIAVAGAIAAGVIWFKSQAHHEADTFVQKFQNPFANAQGTGVINNIVDAFNTAAAAGALNKTQATEALSSVKELWDTFQKQANEFAKGGSDEALVVRQAFETLTPLMTKIMADMQSTIGSIAEDAAALEAATMSADEAAKALADSMALTQSFIDKVANASQGSANLETALSSLEGIGSPTAIILDRLGSDIENFYNVLLKSGLPIPDLIEKYHALAQVHEEVATAAERVVRAETAASSGSGSRIGPDESSDLRAFLAKLTAERQSKTGETIVLNIDGRTIGTIVAPHTFALARNLGVKVTGTR